jgi:hypothetical protein
MVGAGAGGTPGQRPDPGLQLGQFERLDHVVVGTEIEAFDAVAGTVKRSQDQHRQLRVAGPQALEHLEAGQLGQAEIEDQQIVRLAGDRGIRFHAAHDMIDCVAGLAKRARQTIGNDRVVLCEQDAHSNL